MSIATIFLISFGFWGCVFLLNYLLDKFSDKPSEGYFHTSFFICFSIVIIVIVVLHLNSY